ncbi:MAG TPA: PepSY domain-containing protein [Chthoniobacterales bacterium]
MQKFVLVFPVASLLAISTTTWAAPTEAELMKQATISKSQAEQIARAKVPGAKIQSEEIENEHHALVWSFDMVKHGSKNVTEVLVNAMTGKIISVSTETPSDQAKEQAADTANGTR